MPFSSIPFDKIKLVIFDIDGTLYPQLPVRRKMVFALLWQFIKTRSLKTSHLIQAYRKQRDQLSLKDEPLFEKKIQAILTKKFSLSDDEYQKQIEYWLLKKQLPWLFKIRFSDIDQIFHFLRSRKIKIGIFSDYPAKDKLEALNLDVDYCHWAGDPEIKSLKPSPKGILHIMEQAHATPSETLMIGDRDDKDGEAARKAGTYFLLKDKRGKNPNIPSFKYWKDFLLTLQNNL